MKTVLANQFKAYLHLYLSKRQYRSDSLLTRPIELNLFTPFRSRTWRGNLSALPQRSHGTSSCERDPGCKKRIE